MDISTTYNDIAVYKTLVHLSFILKNNKPLDTTFNTLQRMKFIHYHFTCDI